MKIHALFFVLLLLISSLMQSCYFRKSNILMTAKMNPQRFEFRLFTPTPTIVFTKNGRFKQNCDRRLFHLNLFNRYICKGRFEERGDELVVLKKRKRCHCTIADVYRIVNRDSITSLPTLISGEGRSWSISYDE